MKRAFLLLISALMVSVASFGAIDWNSYSWVDNYTADESLTERFKVETEEGSSVQVIGIQQPGWATEPGIYMTFPATIGASGGSETQEYTSTFTSKDWADSQSMWMSNVNGYGYTADRGVQITTSATGAGATTMQDVMSVTKVIITYCTTASRGDGTIVVSVGGESQTQEVTSSGGTTLRELVYEFPMVSGQVSFIVNCTTNSIYINTITISASVASGSSGECTLPWDKYATEGAGIILYTSAFTEAETYVGVMAGGVMYGLTVYNADAAGNTGGDSGDTSGSLTGGQTWEIQSGNILYIIGGGSIDGFTTPEEAPWYDYSGNITALYLNADFFSVGDNVFYSLNSLLMIQSPSSYMPTLTGTSFNPDYIGKHITLKIRESLKSRYESDPYWGQMNVSALDSGGDPTTGDEYTVYWSVNGAISSTCSVEAGGFISYMPDTPTACAEYTFAGWTDTPISGSQSWTPAILYNETYEFPSVSEDVTYYAVFRKDGASGGGTYEMVDVLTREMTGVAATGSYTSWTDVLASSGTMYSGHTAGSNDAIQLKSSGNVGIISTTTIGEAIMISVEWNSKTSTGQMLNIYGSYSPFSSVADLYNDAELIGTVDYNGASVSEYSFYKSYPYIGLRAETGLVYLTKVSITWSVAGAGGTTEYITDCGSSSGDDNKILDSGECGSDAFWEIYENGKLIIKGSGSMYYWPDYQNIPWHNYRAQINSVDVQEGIENLTTAAFFDCIQMSEITLPSTLCCLSDSMFYNCVALRSITCNNGSYPPSISGEQAFQNVTLSEITLVVPEGSGSMYNADYYWGQMNVMEKGSGGDVTDSGLIEGDLYWSFDGSTGLLSITGTGSMPDWIASMAPWSAYVERIIQAYIHNGVTYVCNGAFDGCSNITDVTIAETVDSIGSGIFSPNNNPISMYIQRMTPPGLSPNAFINVEGCVYVYCYESAYLDYLDRGWDKACIQYMDDPTPDDPTQQDEQVVISLTEAWKFIMLPSSALAGNWSMDDITTNGDVLWARYDGEKRAAGHSGWTTVNIESSYYKDWGHIVRAQSGTATLTLRLPADANSHSTSSMRLSAYSAALQQNANWNLIGNPYNASYDIKGLLAAGITAPIHIWNGTGYTTYDPEYDDYTLQPFEAFFIQLPDDAPETIYLSPEYIVGDSTGGNTGGNGGSTYQMIDGELSGSFSVSEGIQVHFSRGNLQYQAGTNTWRFAESQLEYIGEDNATNISESTGEGWIDLFGWGTGNNPTRTTQNGSQYSEFIDWGMNAILNGGNVAGAWQTLKSDEWAYLLQSRANAQQLMGVATINGYTGLILLPDDWFDNGHTSLVDSYTTDEWDMMDSAGAVFLPAAGYRWGSSKMYEVGVSGEYWSATFSATDEAYDLDFKSGSINPMNTFSREYGFSVRLVRQIQ